MRHRHAAVRLLASSLAVLTGAGVLGPGPAEAAGGPPSRIVGVEIKDGEVAVSVGLQDLFGPEERQRLTSGFSTRVLIRAALEEEATGEPIAVAVQRTEIVYDIWDEKFEVRTTRGAGGETRTRTSTADEAIWRATVLTGFPLGASNRLRAGVRYLLVVRGDLNPISEDLLVEVRRWLVQPNRGERRLGAGDSFFGSFVSIFVNPRIEDSERQVRFVSQSFSGGGTTASPAPTRPGGSHR